MDVDLLEEIKHTTGDVQGTNLVYDRIDGMLLEGRFAEVNALLERVVEGHYSTKILVGFLTITKAAREHLPARAHFVERVRGHLQKQLFTAGEIYNLLRRVE